MLKPSIATITQERLVLGAKIDVLSQQERDYEALIKQIRDLKAKVISERQALEEQSKELHASTLPINWLPNELIGQIFVFAIELEASGRPESSSKALEMPVNLLQVCRRWHQVARSTPQIWSTIHLYSPHDMKRAKAYVARSGSAPLTVRIWNDRNLGLTKFTPERSRMSDIAKVLGAYSSRIQHLNVGVRTIEGILPIAKFLRESTITFPLLDYLSLSITTPNILIHDLDRIQTDGDPTPLPVNWVRLKHLKLEEVPILAVPAHLISNLVSLELVYPPRKATAFRPGGRIHPRLSILLQTLSLAASLEELALSNTIPIFDVALPDETATDDEFASGLPIIRLLPVKLLKLRSITWTYPSSEDVYRLMSFLRCPALEKLDIFLKNKEHEQPSLPWRGHPDRVDGLTTFPMAAIPFPSLRDLSFQIPDQDLSISALRKFSFPVLQKLELINVGWTARNPTTRGAKPKSWPIFPRFESLFRDPRLFHLTHLTLCYFKFTVDHRRPEYVFAYTPVLISLSLDFCVGVENLIQVLEERFYNTIEFISSPPATARTRRGVKVCPRLESLSFWGCDDLELWTLVRIVRARKGDENGAAGLGGQVESLGLTNGAGTGVTRGPAGVDGKSTEQKPTMEPAPHIMARKIRPLRRSARQVVESGGPNLLVEGQNFNVPFTNVVSSIVASRELLNPSEISYIRIHHCSLVGESEARALKDDHGVADVIWTTAPDSETKECAEEHKLGRETSSQSDSSQSSTMTASGTNEIE